MNDLMDKKELEKMRQALALMRKTDDALEKIFEARKNHLDDAHLMTDEEIFKSGILAALQVLEYNDEEWQKFLKG